MQHGTMIAYTITLGIIKFILISIDTFPCYATYQLRITTLSHNVWHRMFRSSDRSERTTDRVPDLEQYCLSFLISSLEETSRCVPCPNGSVHEIG